MVAHERTSWCRAVVSSIIMHEDMSTPRRHEEERVLKSRAFCEQPRPPIQALERASPRWSPSESNAVVLPIPSIREGDGIILVYIRGRVAHNAVVPALS